MNHRKTVCAIAGIFAATLSVTTAFAAKSDITVGLQLEPPHLDPTSAAAGAIDQIVYSNIFEGLTRFASDGSIVSGLAKDWNISPDGLTYTFNLQEGVTFHDGTEMNAEDVKFSLDRARAEGSTNAQKALFADIASVDVVSPLTVAVKLSQKNGNFLFNMAWGDAVIVASESIADIKTKPVGTGAFTLSNWIQGDRTLTIGVSLRSLKKQPSSSFLIQRLLLQRLWLRTSTRSWPFRHRRTFHNSKQTRDLRFWLVRQKAKQFCQPTTSKRPLTM